MFWSRRAIEATLSALRAENTDLRTQLRLERDAWTQERQQLLDRLLSVPPDPVRRAPPPEPAPSRTPGERPRRVHYPGYSSSLRPPSPPHMPIPGARTSITDVEKQTVILNATTESLPEKEF